jgi:hypothetical protein
LLGDCARAETRASIGQQAGELVGPTIDIGPAALREAEGGIALRSTTFGDRVIYAFTRDEALPLITAIREELDACADSTPTERLAVITDPQLPVDGVQIEVDLARVESAPSSAR